MCPLHARLSPLAYFYQVLRFYPQFSRLCLASVQNDMFHLWLWDKVFTDAVICWPASEDLYPFSEGFSQLSPSPFCHILRIEQCPLDGSICHPSISWPCIIVTRVSWSELGQPPKIWMGCIESNRTKPKTGFYYMDWIEMIKPSANTWPALAYLPSFQNCRFICHVLMPEAQPNLNNYISSTSPGYLVALEFSQGLLQKLRWEQHAAAPVWPEALASMEAKGGSISWNRLKRGSDITCGQSVMCQRCHVGRGDTKYCNVFVYAIVSLIA